MRLFPAGIAQRKTSLINLAASVRALRVLVAAAVVCLLLATPLFAQDYTITDLGTLPGGGSSMANAINNAGQVVGGSSLANHVHRHAFLWQDDEKGMRDLGTLGGSNSGAEAINDSGQVVGTSSSLPHDVPRAFLWQDGKGMRDLQKISDGFGFANASHSYAYGINDAGQVVGNLFRAELNGDGNAEGHAFLWHDGVGVRDLGTLPSLYPSTAAARAINNAGQVVGHSWVAYDPDPFVRGFRLFFWQDDRIGMRDLRTLAGDGFANVTYSVANAINNAGQVVGALSWDKDWSGNAFLWQDGAGVRDLGTLPGVQSSAEALAINNTGQVVGTSWKPLGINEPAFENSRAFLWQDEIGMRDLNDLIPSDSGWVLREARGVNDAGQIVGFGHHNGKIRAFLLTPCKRPTFPRPEKHLISGHGWSAQVEVSDDDGLVVRDVTLTNRTGQTRYMAKQMSLPYVLLKTSKMVMRRIELWPDSNYDTARSRLVGYKEGVNDERLYVQATYAIDRLGDKDSCLEITQSYEFDKFRPHEFNELSGQFPAQRFFPKVTYKFSGSGGEELVKIACPQRFFYSPDKGPFEEAPGNSGTLFRDINPLSLQDTIMALKTLSPAIAVFGNPMEYEKTAIAINNGERGEVDNLHQHAMLEPITPPTGFPHGFQIPATSFSLPGDIAVRPGGPHCVHTHWRWLSLNEAYLPELPGWWEPGKYSGKPMIPPGSKQSVVVGVVAFRGTESEEDPESWQDLANNESVYGPTGSKPIVFWYEGSSAASRDEFYIHGGFFAPRADRLKVGTDIEITAERLLVGPPLTRYPRVWYNIKNISNRTIYGPFHLVFDKNSGLRKDGVIHHGDYDAAQQGPPLMDQVYVQRFPGYSQLAPLGYGELLPGETTSWTLEFQKLPRQLPAPIAVLTWGIP